MNKVAPFRPLAYLPALLVLVILLSAISVSQTESAIYSFAGQPGDGQYPIAGLIFDNTGAAYGTTSAGGEYNAGTVFKLSVPSDGGSWTETVLYSFEGASDGSAPNGGVILDSEGALYGATASGGIGSCVYHNLNGCGVVYKLTPPASGDAWTESVLYSFTGGNDGANPLGNPVLDKSGVLYGTTLFGGTGDSGTVFELHPSASGAWVERVIHNFGAAGDGAYPVGSVVFDADGDMYGTTAKGGQSVFWGTVFKLHPTSSGHWAEAVLYSFTNGSDGGEPFGTLTFDAKGNLYSTTFGGGERGNGTVFELARPAAGSDVWTESVLYSFIDGADGGLPEAGVIFDRDDNLYGTASGGGESGYGTVFKLTHPAAEGDAWTFDILYPFTGETDGGIPQSNLVFGPGALLYGTTDVGGTSFNGVVFDVQPEVTSRSCCSNQPVGR